MDERLVIRRAAAGDQDAFRTLYDENVERIYRLAFRMTGDDDVARECAQEAFIQAFTQLEEFRRQARFSTWLHSIAVNVTLNWIRRLKRRGAREVDLDSGKTPRGSQGRSDPTVKDRIGTAVDGLPEIYRTVFLMHDVEGYKHREIAQTLDIAVGTSKARLSRARMTLREHLGDEMREYVS